MPKDGYFRSETDNDQTISFLSKKNLKTFRCTCRLQFWENSQKINVKSPIYSLNDQKTWAKFLHSRETSKKCSSEHFESSFAILRVFLFTCSNFSGRSPKMIYRNDFSTNFFLLFFVLVGCFLDTLTFFLSKDKKKLLKLQNRWTNLTFPRKKTFFQKMPLDARIAVVTTREKTFRLSVFWIKVQGSVKEYI